MAAALLVAVLVATGCGLVSSSGAFRTGSLPDGATPLAGTDLVVSSKSFTEGVLLGKITATYLASAGADVTDFTGAPGSASSRQAQLNGDVDLLWEYTGTAWVNYHNQTEVITDAEELWQRVTEIEGAEHDLVWEPPANFNNTYAFAASPGSVDRLGVTTLSGVAALPVAERTFCVDDEFFSRSDGLVAMLADYDIAYDSPDGVPAGNVTRMDAGVIYPSTAAAAPCNFGMVYSTDGRIPNLSLQILDDDRGFFLPYSGAAVLRGEVSRAHPELAPLLATLSERLTDDVMRRLNARVDIDGDEPAEVAYDWLRGEGLIV